MRIAVDAMGGDHAPHEIVKGALAAAPDVTGDILLVGKPSEIQHHLGTNVPSNVHIHPATEIVEMDEPGTAVRAKRDSSLAVSLQLVADGECEAAVSAGNTGAATAGAIMFWKRIHGVSRPAIATQIPSRVGRFVLLDSGATPDCDPKNLLEFALMGAAYASAVLKVSRPRVGLLNIGEEPGKGNTLVKKAYALMEAHVDNFVGNVEGKHMFSGNVDVVVCDAFVGNIVLKTGEGIAEMIMRLIKDALPQNFLLRLPLPLLLGGLKNLKKNLDYSEYGGAPLLGVNGVLIIAHGRSDAKAIQNAILQASIAVESDLVGLIGTQIAKERQEEIASA